MTACYVWILKCPARGERYELRKNPSRHGKPISRDEAEELISLPGTVRVRRISFKDGYLNETYELGDPCLRGASNRSGKGDPPADGAPESFITQPGKEASVSNETLAEGDPGAKEKEMAYTGSVTPGSPDNNFGKLTEKFDGPFRNPGEDHGIGTCLAGREVNPGAFRTLPSAASGRSRRRGTRCGTSSASPGPAPTRGVPSLLQPRLSLSCEDFLLHATDYAFCDRVVKSRNIYTEVTAR